VSFENHAEIFDNHIASSITDHLFENNKMGKPGLDLAALNIQVTKPTSSVWGSSVGRER
jgi:hypothetical protein